MAGFKYTGPYRYLITICSHLRQSVFLNSDLALATLDQFRRTAVEDHFAILAYCMMPDHVHLLVEGRASDSDLKRFIRIGKQRSAYLYSRTTGGGQLWQEGFHDRALRREDDVTVAARYVLENPVRAGLVAAASDYQHSGSDVWTIAHILSV